MQIFFHNFKGILAMVVINNESILISILLVTFVISCAQNTQTSVTDDNSKKVTKRVGMVIGIKPEFIDEYKMLHADSNAGVRDLLSKYNMHNFSIFIQQFDDGKSYLFGYWEYTDSNYEKNMADLAKELRNIDWLKVTDPMQIPFKGESSWKQMEQVYYNK